MSLLSIIQDAADIIGIDKPVSIIGNTGTTSSQMLAMLTMSGRMLARRHDWQALINEHVFNTAASTESYALPADYDRHIDDTAWDRTNLWNVRGSITPREWQIRKSGVVPTGVRRRFRVKGGFVFIDPIPTTIDSLVYEYISKNWITDSAGASAASAFVADTDITIFSETLMTLDLIWRFKKEKGFDYAEDFRDFETHFQIEKQIDTPSSRLNMAGNGAVVTANVQEAGFG